MEEQKESPPAALEKAASMEELKYREELATKMGLPSPYGMNLMKQVCSDMVASGLAPAHFKANPMALYLAAMRGREMDLSPMESILDTFWAAPGGRLGIYSNKLLDLLHRRGIRSKFLVETVEQCRILFTPPADADHEPYEASFTIEEAKTAQLVRPDSNWIKYPKSMLRARAISNGWRAMAGVVKGGANILTKEELEDSEYETVSPSTNGSPEVQAPQSEPAKAGRKPKEKPTITVQPDEVVDPPKPADPPPAQQSEKPAQPATAPSAPVAPAQKYYVISSESQIPTLEQVQPGPLVEFKISVLDTPDIGLAMKTCDSLSKDSGIEHYILTFTDGKASVIHRTKLPKYIVVPEGGLKAATTTAQIEALAFGPPHVHMNIAEVFAQSEANRVGGIMLVVHKEGARYELDSKWLPAVKPNSVPAAAPESPSVAVDDQAARDALKLQHDRIVIAMPENIDIKQRKEILYAYIKAYLGISNMKDFSKDLVAAQECLNACERDLSKDPAAFVQNSESLGKTAKDMALPLQSKAPAESPDIAVMAKYYTERKWNGMTTSLAESYRKATCPDPVKFQSILKSSGIAMLEEKNAAAYFAVGVSYSKDTAVTFGTNVEGPQYAETLTKVRNFFDGEELAKIPESKFLSTLAEVLKGKEPEEPSLFG